MLDSDEQLRQYNLAVDDQLLKRKLGLGRQIHFIESQPLPSIIEISESGVCNRSCSFCPRSAPDFEQVNEFITPELIRRLSDDLASVDYAGVIIFSGFVEPLLDKNIAKHISTLKKYVPKSRIEVVTNGDPLTQKKLDELGQCGLDALLISCYDGEHQPAFFSKMIRGSSTPPLEVICRKRWGGIEENFDLSLSNRGGMMVNAAFPIDVLHSPWSRPCYYPSYTFFLDYHGDVLVCPHDWGKKAVVGNLNVSTLLDIWTGAEFTSWRKMMLDGNRSKAPCDGCNVDGMRIGEKHAEAWLSLYNGSN